MTRSRGLQSFTLLPTWNPPGLKRKCVPGALVQSSELVDGRVPSTLVSITAPKAWNTEQNSLFSRKRFGVASVDPPQ